MRAEREELVAKFMGQLTPGAKVFGAVLAMELCQLTKDNPRAHATITARGLEFGDVATLHKLCGEFGLDLSVATASEDPHLRLQRVGPRAAQPTDTWRRKVIARVERHLNTRSVN